MGQPDVEDKRETYVGRGDVDAALEYLDHEDTTIMSTIDERKLVRKIDWMIVPSDPPRPTSVLVELIDTLGSCGAVTTSNISTRH